MPQERQPIVTYYVAQLGRERVAQLGRDLTRIAVAITVGQCSRSPRGGVD